MSESFKINAQGWATKKVDRSRGRMKITFKLNKEESEAFKNWETLLKGSVPEGYTDETFYKTIFMHGISFINNQLQSFAQAEIAKENLRKQKEEATQQPKQE